MNLLHGHHRLAALALIAATAPAIPSFAQEMAKPTTEMQAVLDKLGALEAKPFSTLSVSEARTQASPADAAKAVQWDKRLSSNPGGEGPFPVVVYYHGGGWVVADINVYDGAPRALAMGANAIVVSVEYRHAPEHKFPAAHDDAWTAYKWVVENIHELNGNSDRLAVAGESAGGNLAANIALMAKEQKTKQPVHQLLVYPVAGNDMNTLSYKENAEAKPLAKADMEWFVKNTVSSMEDSKDPRINLNGRSDLEGLAPATVILAQIDPLRSDGESYATKLKDAGVAVNMKTYPGVTHEFFGMGKVVPEAKQALDLAVADLTTAFNKAQ